MPSLNELFEKLKRVPVDVLGLDVRPDGVNAARMRRAGDSLSLVASAVLPPPDKDGNRFLPLRLPSNLRAPYVSLATEGDQVSVRLLSLPTPHEHGIEEKLLSGLNLRDSAGHRIGYRVVLEGHGKQESVVLAVALAEQEAVSLLDLFPSGRPAPCSIELSGLAAMSAFLAGPASDHRNKAVAALDIGINSSMFMAFNKNVPMVCQRLDIGTRSILLKVQESLGVNEETARGVVTDGAFDVADVAGEVAGRLLNRIAVSRDFVERREGCRIRALYVSGALETARDLVKQMESSFDVVKWNPLEAAHPSGAGKADESAEPSRLAAAVGLCLATLEPQ